MSVSVREQTDDDRKIELGTEVNWPPIIAAASLGLVVLMAVAVLAFVAPKKDAPLSQPVLVKKAPEKDPLLAGLPENWTPPNEPRPLLTVVAELEKPATSQKPKTLSKPVIVKSTPVPVSPPKAEPLPVVQGPPEPPFKRRSLVGEEELRERLIKESRELDIETEKGTTTKLLAEVPTIRKTQRTDKEAAKPQAKTPPILELIAKRDDLKGLPLRDVNKCQVPAKEAKIMAEMSGTVRAASSASRVTSSSRYSAEYKYLSYLDQCLKGPEWREDTGVRMTVQMLQVDNEAVRMKMIKLLADNKKEKTTSAALAQRAVYDLNLDVRLSAITALRGRPRTEYRSVLLDALSYPWSPVADNAAEALVALNDRAAVTELTALLDKPDPQAPTQKKDRTWVKPELVRVNHLGNCVLCHAPCSAKEETVRGVVPERGQPLPVMYYESEKGDFVRADVTYLKQDFSTMQFVEKPGKWPSMQRFDYLIRQRELSADEVSILAKAKGDSSENNYPQREAVLWALRELTGEDKGAKSEGWKQYLIKEQLKTIP